MSAVPCGVNFMRFARASLLAAGFLSLAPPARWPGLATTTLRPMFARVREQAILSSPPCPRAPSSTSRRVPAAGAKPRKALSPRAARAGGGGTRVVVRLYADDYYGDDYYGDDFYDDGFYGGGWAGGELLWPGLGTRASVVVEQ